MIEAIVINRLLRWSKWKMQTGVQLGYPSQTTFVRLAPATTHFRDPGIDADNLLTDRAYKQLPEVYMLVIRLEHIEPLLNEDHRVRRYGKSRRTYRDDRTTAYTMIGNMIDTLINSRQEQVA